MAMNSGARKNAPLRTYSKRVQTCNEEPPFKKRRVEGSLITKSPPPVIKAKTSSIISYFKPLPTSSSPTSTWYIQETSDPAEPIPTPPSSPPLRSHSPPGFTPKPQKRLRRRLTTRPSLVPIRRMSSLPNNVPQHGGDDDCQGSLDSPEDQSSVNLAEECFAGKAGIDVAQSVTVRSSVWRNNISGQSTPSEPIRFQGSSNGPCMFAAAVDPSNAALGSERSDSLNEPRADQTDLIAIPSQHSKPKPRPQSFEQQQLDLGIPALTVCKDCGMHYNRTLRDDRQQHESFHKSVVRGKTVKLNTAKVVLIEKVVGGRQHRVQVIDRRESCEWRLMAEDALKLSLRDLPGVLPEEAPLWSEICNTSSPRDSVKVPRYKVYIYTIQLEVVAILLAERISEGGAYYYGPMTHDEHGKWPTEVPAPEEQEYVSKDITYPALLSIDRIWTHPDHRRKGFAEVLVDLARQEFVSGLVLSKKQVAFSLPTTMGREFAANYCNGVFPDAAFLINLSDCPTFVEDDMLVHQA